MFSCLNRLAERIDVVGAYCSGRQAESSVFGIVVTAVKVRQKQKFFQVLTLACVPSFVRSFGIWRRRRRKVEVEIEN